MRKEKKTWVRMRRNNVFVGCEKNRTRKFSWARNHPKRQRPSLYEQAIGRHWPPPDRKRSDTRPMAMNRNVVFLPPAPHPDDEPCLTGAPWARLAAETGHRGVPCLVTATRRRGMPGIGIARLSAGNRLGAFGSGEVVDVGPRFSGAAAHPVPFRLRPNSGHRPADHPGGPRRLCAVDRPRDRCPPCLGPPVPWTRGRARAPALDQTYRCGARPARHPVSTCRFFTILIGRRAPASLAKTPNCSSTRPGDRPRAAARAWSASLAGAKPTLAGSWRASALFAAPLTIPHRSRRHHPLAATREWFLGAEARSDACAPEPDLRRRSRAWKPGLPGFLPALPAPPRCSGSRVGSGMVRRSHGSDAGQANRSGDILLSSGPARH